MNETCIFQLTLDADHLCWRVDGGPVPLSTWHRVAIDPVAQAHMMEAELYVQTRPVWHACLPVQSLECQLDATLTTPNADPDVTTVQRVARDFCTTLINTNARMMAWHADQRCAADWDGVLFYLPDQTRIYDDYRAALEKILPGRVFTRFYHYREVLRGTEQVESVATLLAYCRTNKIRTIISHNTQYPFWVLAAPQQLALFPLLRWLGMEWICCDLDTYENSAQLHQQALADATFRRFAIEPHNQRDWEKIYGPLHVDVIPARSCIGEDLPFATLQDDYRLFVASNSRAWPLQRTWSTLLWVLEQCDPRHLYRDVTWWYYALRNIVVDRAIAEPRRTEIMMGQLYHLYLDLYALLKLIVIDEWRGDRPLEIYGDDDWGVLFPEYYQGRYLAEPEYAKLLQSGRSLSLLFNQNFSYLANNPVIRRCLALRVPFLSYECLVSTPEFAAFRAAEYGSATDLSPRPASAINAIFSAPEFRAATQRYTQLHRDYARDWAAYVARPASPDPAQRHFTTDYRRIDDAHTALWDGQLATYIQQHAALLQQSVDLLWNGGTLPLEPADSRYAGTRFVDRLHGLWRTG